MQKTLKTGLIGAHLGHSYSPRIHKALGDDDYRLIELSAEALGDFLQNGDFDAVNVTIPYKKDVIPYLAHVSSEAARIGAVNTIVRGADGKLYGYNTDYDGMREMIDAMGISMQGKKVLVLGSGGASRTAVTVSRDMGALAVVVISRSGEDNYQNLDRHADADVIINTTPVGMYPNNGEAPLSLDIFKHLEAVLDLIYNPARTALLMDAEARGIPCCNGLLMLVSQARRARELFTGRSIERSVSAKITRELEKEAENIVLIGMPGCGKSTLGKRLAADLGREFVDADAEIVAEAGCTIPEIFEAEGEVGFRRRESAVLARLGKEKGLVIATGGGAVTVPENQPLLRQNGRLVFLDVAPENLSTKGRPLSAARTPEVIYRERLPLYRKFASVTVPLVRSACKEADIEKNLENIKEALL